MLKFYCLSDLQLDIAYNPRLTPLWKISVLKVKYADFKYWFFFRVRGNNSKFGIMTNLYNGIITNLYSGIITYLYSGIITNLYSGIITNLYSGIITNLYSGIITNICILE